MIIKRAYWEHVYILTVWLLIIPLPLLISFHVVFWLLGFPKVWLCCFLSGQLVFFPDLLRQWQGLIHIFRGEFLAVTVAFFSYVCFLLFSRLGSLLSWSRCGIAGGTSRLGCDNMFVFLALLDNFMVTRLEICSRISTVSSIFYFCS